MSTTMMSSPPETSDVTQQKERPLILNVDDDPIGRYTRTYTLRRAGYEVLEAESGGEALRLAAGRRPHLILLDVRLPDMDGFEVCRRIKRDPQTQAISVLQFSAAFTGARDKVSGLDAGADAYLVTPTEPEVLLATVRAVLRVQSLERDLRRSERELSDFFENVDVGLHWAGPDGKILRVNQAELDLLGYTREEYLGAAFRDFFVDPAVAVEEFRRLHEGETLRDFPAQLRRKDGSIRDVLINAGVLWEDGRFVHTRTVTRDVTQEKRAAEILEQRVAERTAVAEERAAQLQMLAAQLTQAEQRERRRLAQVLHDHLQQLLVAAQIQMSMLASRLQAPRDRETLQQANHLIAQAIDESRSLTVELSPPVLHENGLGAALAWLARQTQERHGLTVAVDADPAANPASLELRDFLFQAVRELLFNVVKHGQVTQARVRVQRPCEGTVQIEVLDQGDGFDPQVLEKKDTQRDHYGIVTIRHRLQLLGGSLNITSRPGAGTCCTIEAPLQ